MKVLLIGSGGREHALAWKFSQSPKLTQLFVAPGNPGIAQLPKTRNVEIVADQIQKLCDFAIESKIDFTFVGPEQPLSMGIVDLFRSKGLLIFGPEKKAAALESSKGFAKEIMVEAGIPTAAYESFNDLENLEKYLEKCAYPIVLKADGLAAGKGVAVCPSMESAKAFAKQIFIDKVFGDSGSHVIAEEFIDGRECSILAICDGNSYQLLASAQDHKRLLDQDLGPNTGGMGAYAPSSIFDAQLEKMTHAQVFEPVLKTLKNKGINYTGILYAGLMVNKNGLKVLEFNARFGDPETQVILPLMENDLLQVMIDAAQGKLSKHQLTWKKNACLTVVLAAQGYPEQPQKGAQITGLSTQTPDAIVFHAGTTQKNDQVVVSGGRVLTITALGETINEARTRAYDTVHKIKFDGMQFRKDIGLN